MASDGQELGSKYTLQNCVIPSNMASEADRIRMVLPQFINRTIRELQLPHVSPNGNLFYNEANKDGNGIASVGAQYMRCLGFRLLNSTPASGHV